RFSRDWSSDVCSSDLATKSMCGNGSRCAVRYAHRLGIIDQHCTFMAFDGLHTATVEGEQVSLRMGDVQSVRHSDEDDFFVNTGRSEERRVGKECKDRG